MPVSIPAELLGRIRELTEKDYPHETCGILVSPRGSLDRVSGIYPCRNIQDECHTEDPVNFSRTSETAYFMSPGDLLKIQKEARQKQSQMRVIYHSHVDAGAYFSEEDQRVALSEGEPVYPGVSYLVVSVQKGKAGEMSIFEWDGKTKTFLKTLLDSK